jgi:hypothetical protein
MLSNRPENADLSTMKHRNPITYCYHYQQDLPVISSFTPCYIRSYNIMSIQPHSRQHATPPESFTNPPLTPPPTDEKGLSLVSRIVEEIKNRREGRDLKSTPWVVYSLSMEGYQELQHELERDESLCGFAQHKLRYEEP